ncbi:MAG: fumarylacetoacetate hydrolase family protein [Armatimonadetes bacterium]|nr:fumarylacetoacetate hydrolase family protein [Armatimonadota bacterium]MDE2207361.1 fumarylacetoacetate hydrolase family protein [Armatimonadota bacterium]
MRLVRFNEGRLGVATPNGSVIDLAAAAGPAGIERFPASMSAFLARGAEGFADAVRTADAASPTSVLPPGSVQLLSPVGDPPKIICIGQNYRDHCAEQNQPIPERAIIFSKFATALNRPGGAIVLPKISEQVDYEAELAFVIGVGGRDIPESEARRHIAGYMCANDVSARDIQFGDKQWVRGKTFDSFFPCGPWLVTADEIDDPHNLAISLTLNGKVMQQSNTGNLVFGVDSLVSYLSQVVTLQPGDIVSTGTPGGVGVFRDPPVFLLPGDEVAVTISGLGTLTNTVTAA